MALPNIFVFQILLPLISPIIDLMFLGSLAAVGIGAAAFHVDSSNVDYGGRAAIGALFSGISDH